MLIFGAALALIVWTATVTYWVINRKRKALPQAPVPPAAETQAQREPPLDRTEQAQLAEIRRQLEQIREQAARHEEARARRGEPPLLPVFPEFPAFPEFPQVSRNIEAAMRALVRPDARFNVTTTTTRTSTVGRNPTPEIPPPPPTAPPQAAVPAQPRSVYERLRDPWPTTTTEPEPPETTETRRKT